MTGDQQDMLARLRTVLPARWFPHRAPVLDGLLGGLAAGWCWAYQQLQYVKAQTRIATATDVWLDIIANDFFGNRLSRRTGQSDDAFRNRIRRELFRERGTRAAIVAVLEDLTGRTPLIFEPARSTDTGGYTTLNGAGGGVGYGCAGGWGSLMLPFQYFVTAIRPTGQGVINVAGWGTVPPGGISAMIGMPAAYGDGTLHGASAGSGTGAVEYATMAMVAATVTDADILAVINDVRPAGTIAWTDIVSAYSPPAPPGAVAGLIAA
jgi:hypothetical protein